MSMKLTIVQSDIVWADPLQNISRLDSILESIEDSDLIVLPEMFTTGFATRPEGIAEPEHGIGLKWMISTAARKDCAIAGTIAIHTLRADYRNRFYFVKPDGSVEHYDKKHLFTYSGEHKSFHAGNEKKIVEWRGVKFLLQVCYDLRFPVFSRNFIASDGRPAYDVALYPASWPDVRNSAWEVLLKARAIENQCYLAGVNRVGSDPANVYCGSSVILDPFGDKIANCTPHKEHAVSAIIDLSVLEDYRKRFPVLNDADSLV